MTLPVSRQERIRMLLTQIHDEHGELTPDLVVKTATPKNHPLHSEFDWDNKVAGDQWRRDQAHRLIQFVRVKFRDRNEDEHDVRAFIAVPRAATAQPSYEPVHDVIGDDFRRKLMLQEADRQWKTLRSRYGHLVEFADIVLDDLRGQTG